MFNYVWTTITKIFKSDDNYHTGDISKCPFMNSPAPKELTEKQSVDDHETKV
jgi:hypothetical protein